jgi:hypothetical protein
MLGSIVQKTLLQSGIMGVNLCQRVFCVVIKFSNFLLLCKTGLWKILSRTVWGAYLTSSAATGSKKRYGNPLKNCPGWIR